MLTRAVRLALRASAVASASSAAPVSDVWAVLAHPQRWVEFDPFIRSVTVWPVVDEPDESPPGSVAVPEGVAAGQRLRARLRLIAREVPVEVDHVVDRSALALTSRLFPGLEEEVEHLVIPSTTGGTYLTARFTLHGPFALPALLPCWIVRALTVRLLARAAEGRLRARAQNVPSVA